MSFIFLIIFLFFLGPFIGRALSWLFGKLFRRYVEKKIKDQQDYFYRQAGLDPEEVRRQQQEQETIRNRGGWSSPTPKKKKIDPSVAESIKYREVTVTETTKEVQDSQESQASQGSRNSQASQKSQGYSIEEQIIDVEWTDIEIQK